MESFYQKQKKKIKHRNNQSLVIKVKSVFSHCPVDIKHSKNDWSVKFVDFVLEKNYFIGFYLHKSCLIWCSYVQPTWAS